ncbi:hypothetical protein P775_20480 [Puniceibacterium antarcticum]|uniref:Uncharacterized protein n=1 Tax=Puniceibacterium antarcticum TaxID=1206336 RepID=A0A2G8R9X0_9RHOB|nr:hypothetical protein [Puniceibacterium antarcticum]PIL18329.1 hypothetical protein P775_20480 [Puniceibacterium antarcticum]
MTDVVLILGSGPNAPEVCHLPSATFDALVCINNAWRVRHDWTHMIYPEDFPPERRPLHVAPLQKLVTAEDFVSAQNHYGGFIFGGGTMAFTAGYWALHALRPRVLAYLGCDMVYPAHGPTHFYGTGTADPLRDDPTLQSLRAKSARLQILAGRQGCAVVNLSRAPSRLVSPRAKAGALRGLSRPEVVARCAADAEEARLGYIVESGRYWEQQGAYDPAGLRALDLMWLSTWRSQRARSAVLA